MPFRCPQCKSPGSLDIAASIELPPDSRSDEISLQVVACSDCQFRGLAVYEESRRGAIDSESWNHIGYWVSPDAVASVLKAIRSCPTPRNAKCKCPAHTSLGKKDVRGVWRGLLEMERSHTFSMRMYLN
jgi:hypothetical protein